LKKENLIGYLIKKRKIIVRNKNVFQ